MFANGPGDLGSVPGRVIPKTQKMVLDASLLNTQHYKVRIKGKVEQSREGVAPSPTPWCSSYRKGSLRVTLDYGRQLTYFLFLDTPLYSMSLMKRATTEPLFHFISSFFFFFSKITQLTFPFFLLKLIRFYLGKSLMNPDTLGATKLSRSQSKSN